MNSVTLKTSSENWINDIKKQCKSYKTIQVINDNSLKQDDFIKNITDLLERFTLSSKQLVLRNVLLFIVPILGLIGTLVLGYGIILGVTHNDTNITTIIIVQFSIWVSLSVYTTRKLLKARKPSMLYSDDEVTINWVKY